MEKCLGIPSPLPSSVSQDQEQAKTGLQLVIGTRKGWPVEAINVLAVRKAGESQKDGEPLGPIFVQKEKIV